MLRAILFDFNGILVDDEPIHHQLVLQVLAEEGLELGADEYRARFVGLSDRACFAAAMRAAGVEPDPTAVVRLVARKASYYQEVMRRQGFPFFPGAVALVRQAGEAGCMLGVVSGALREEVEGALEQAGIRDRFKTLIAAEDVARGKPDPEGYRRAVGELNSLPPLPQRLIHPHEVLAIEDSPRGLRAAASAGLVSLGIAQTFSRRELDMADHVAEGLGGLTFTDLQRLYAESSRR
ncbi:MAG: HAD family phosphatase [Thermoanaerobaculia bacterium]|nr:HAD family phosphatase [Thermoanaerobaculia bacterium]